MALPVDPVQRANPFARLFSGMFGQQPAAAPQAGMMSAPPAPPAGMMGAQQQAPRPGFLQNNSNMLLGLGMGLLAHRQNALANPLNEVFKQGMLGSVSDTARLAQQDELANRNQTYDWLVNVKKLPPETARAALANPAIMTSILQGADDYELAVQQGFVGTKMDYEIALKQAGRDQINIGNKLQPPTNYRWKHPEWEDPSLGGAEPIEGGPGEEIPAEVASRIGLADVFVSGSPMLREKISKGAVTGLWDNLSGRWVDSSAAAEIMRDVGSGTDALQRMLTGAGMPQSEAEVYMKRYAPSITDSPASAVSKLDRLVIELTAIKSIIMRGRGKFETGELVEEMRARFKATDDAAAADDEDLSID